MTGNPYLDLALISAGIVIFLWTIGRLANRWRDKLERDLKRMKEGKDKES